MFDVILTQAMDIIEVYKNDPDQPLAVITDDRLRLSTLLLELQNYASDGYDAWDNFDRQAEVLENKLYLESTGTIPEKKAMVKTNEQLVDLTNQARDNKNLYKRLESFIRRGDAVLEGMKQKIAHIKKEIDNAKSHTSYS
jgi:hypothetical protein